jgi:hypothetical protein
MAASPAKTYILNEASLTSMWKQTNGQLDASACCCDFLCCVWPHSPDYLPVCAFMWKCGIPLVSPPTSVALR